MASGTLANFNFDQTLFASTANALFTTRLGLMNGIMRRASEQEIPVGTGYTVDVPRFEHITGDSVQITTSTTTTINAPSDFSEKAVWVQREKAWGADQVINTIAGKDPMLAVAGMVADYWKKEMQRIAILSAGGLFTTAFATLVKDSSGAPVDETNFIAAKQKLGDNMDEITESVMHSLVYAKALQLKIVADTGGADSFVSGVVPRMLGTNVSVTDELADTGGVYPTYIGAPGSILYQLRPLSPSIVNDANVYDLGGIQVEIGRESLKAGGQDYLVTRADFCVHVRGAKWNSSTTNPTDANLALDSNWAKAPTDDKYIRLVQLLTGGY